MADEKSWVPGAYHKIQDRNLSNMTGLNDRSFSFGERLDLSCPANNYPSSKYIIPGFCDKFLNTKRKN